MIFRRNRSRSRSHDRKELERLRKLAEKMEEADGPELFRIYSGKVQNITNFGCFVSLEGFKKKKVEGLVHISQLKREGRVKVGFYTYLLIRT